MNSLESIRESLSTLAKSGYVFRGETCPRLAIHPTLGRLQHQFPGEQERKDKIRGQAYTILQWSHRIKSQVLADITQDEWYALLRHYGWPVPLLDVTFDPEVAIWFALLNRKSGDRPSVIYALPVPAGDAPVRLISHEQLLRNPEYARLNCRWTVQKGGALFPIGWPDMTSAEEFDMLRMPGLTAFFFVPDPTDQAKVVNLLTTEGDGIAARLSDWLGSVAQVVGGFDELDPHIRSHLEGMG